MFRNTIILFFLIILLPVLLLAQDEAEPLTVRLKNTHGSEKIDIMNQISVIYRKTNRFKALDFARQAYELSVKTNYLPGKALAKKNEGICWFFIGNNDSASLCYLQSLETYTRIKDDKGKSACLNNLGLIAQETGNYNEAIKYYERSIEMDQKLGDVIGVALTKENMADIYIYQGDVKTALKLTNESIDIYTARAYKPGLMACFTNRGSEFAYLKQFDNSVRDYNQALDLAVELKDKYQEIMANGNLGFVYWSMKKPEIAMKYLNLALEMSDESDDAFNIDRTLSTMAEIYTSQKEYARSIDILQKLLKRNEGSGNVRQAAAIMTLIGRNLIELNEMDKAVGYLSKSLQITQKINAKYEMLENYRNLAHANAILHNFSTADSLQDLFAETYTDLLNMDSIAGKSEKKQKSIRIGPSSSSTAGNWAVAFLLFALILMMSVFAFPKK